MAAEPPNQPSLTTYLILGLFVVGLGLVSLSVYLDRSRRTQLEHLTQTTPSPEPSSSGSKEQ